MKKLFNLSMLAIAAMAAFSCTMEPVMDQELQEPQNVFEPKVITAYTDADVNADTKTSLSGVSILWATTDNIKGWDGSTVHTSTSTAVSDGNKKADFTFETVNVEDNLLNLAYPAENVSDIDDDFVYATIPTTQTATAGSFADGANVAVAEGLTDNPVFKNVGGLLSFTFNNDNITSVTLFADEELTGASMISMDNADFAEAAVVDGKKFVTVSGTISNGSTYYAVVYPGTYHNLKIEVRNTAGQVATYTNPNELEVGRNANLHIATLTIPDGKWMAVYQLVKDVSELTTNSKVLITNLEGTKAISTTQSGNNRPEADVTMSESKITNPDDDVEVFTIKSGTETGTLAFLATTEAGYIYAASSSSNYLRTQADNNANGSWSVSINSSTGEADVIAQGSNTHNTLKYNSASKIFSCYASGQAKVAFYKLVGSGNPLPSGGSVTANVTISDYASLQSWTNSTKYSSITIDESITASVYGTGANSGKYYTSSPTGWRFYESEASTTSLRIAASGNHTIQSVNVEYNSKNNGTLIHSETNIASGDDVSVNDSYIDFTVGRTTGSSNGQVAISKITVVYK